MEINYDVAMKLWKDVFGNNDWAIDCFGTWMYKYDYGKTDTMRIRPGGDGNKYNYCWCIDHIRPVSSFDSESEATFWNNLEPVQYSNNSAKSNKTSFSINGINYKVVVCEICKKNNQTGYGIKNMDSGKRVDWKYVNNSYYA